MCVRKRTHRSGNRPKGITLEKRLPQPICAKTVLNKHTLADARLCCLTTTTILGLCSDAGRSDFLFSFSNGRNEDHWSYLFLKTINWASCIGTDNNDHVLLYGDSFVLPLLRTHSHAMKCQVWLLRNRWLCVHKGLRSQHSEQDLRNPVNVLRQIRFQSDPTAQH